MKPEGEHAYPKTAEEAHDFMVDLLDEALADGRSAFLVTMKPLPAGMVDIKSGMMNLDQHEKGMVMVSFAVVQMHRKSESDIKEDMATLGRFVGRMLE